MTSKESDERYTPQWLVEAAREAMGGIDMDPASCLEANLRIGSTRYLSLEDDGLATAWVTPGYTTAVWCNPPYSRGSMIKWVKRFVDQSQHFAVGCLLVNSNTSAKWFRLLFDEMPALFLKNRLTFHPQPTPAFWPSCLFVGGCDRALVEHVQAELNDLGVWAVAE